MFHRSVYRRSCFREVPQENNFTLPTMYSQIVLLILFGLLLCQAQPHGERCLNCPDYNGNAATEPVNIMELYNILMKKNSNHINKELRSQIDAYMTHIDQAVSLSINSWVTIKNLNLLIEILKTQNDTISAQLKDLQEQVEEQNNTIDNKDMQIVKLKSQLEEIKKIKKLEENPPSSCIPFGSSAGVYRIKTLGNDSFDVLCDSQTAGDGWTVIQQRLDGKENFTRNWDAYRNGFGSFDGDFFLGLEKIHHLTSERRHILHIHMEDFNGTIHFVQYDHFNVSSVDELYELNRLGQFSGNTTYNTLRMHINQKFTTYDRDNDISGSYNCADHNGGWWYTNCVHTNLNGLFFNESVKNNRSMHWKDFDALRRVKMLIRPKID